MDTSDSVTSNGAGASDDASFPYDEVEVIVSDLHLSAGKTLLVRVRHTWRFKVRRLVKMLRGLAEPPDVVEAENPLEDFLFDGEFVAFLDKIVESFGRARVLRLRLMGDCFDPLAVTWRGKMADPPFESVGAYKMRQIIRGHGRYFDALAAFVRLPNARLDVFVGNHDQFLCWTAVQRLLLRRVAGYDPVRRGRVRFIDQSVGFTDSHRGIEYYHGMNAEPHNVIDPRNAILFERFGLRLKHPMLNKPLGSDMSVGLANRIKLQNSHVGRLRSEKEIWSYAAKFKWMWAVLAAFHLAAHLLSNQVSVLWDWRRKTGFLMLFRMMLDKLRESIAVVVSTTQRNPVDAYAEREMRRRPEVRLFVLGHSHSPRLVQGLGGSYLNTGTWSKKLRFVYPTFEYRWRHFRTVEVLWYSLRHFLSTGKFSYGRQLTKLIGFIGMAAAMSAFLLTSFARNRFHVLWYDLLDFKLPVGIMLVFFVLGGIFRIFAVKPHEVDDTRLTFGLVRHGKDGSLCVDLKEYQPGTDSLRDYV